MFTKNVSKTALRVAWTVPLESLLVNTAANDGTSPSLAIDSILYMGSTGRNLQFNPYLAYQGALQQHPRKKGARRILGRQLRRM